LAQAQASKWRPAPGYRSLTNSGMGRAKAEQEPNLKARINFQFPLLVQGAGEGEVTRSRGSSGDCQSQRCWPAWSKWFLKGRVPPLPNPPLGQREGVRRILPTDSTAPFETFDGRGVRRADRSPQSSGTREFALRADPSPRNDSRFEAKYRLPPTSRSAPWSLRPRSRRRNDPRPRPP
jgi:hypothetical protein